MEFGFMKPLTEKSGLPAKIERKLGDILKAHSSTLHGKLYLMRVIVNLPSNMGRDTSLSLLLSKSPFVNNLYVIINS